MFEKRRTYIKQIIALVIVILTISQVALAAPTEPKPVEAPTEAITVAPPEPLPEAPEARPVAVAPHTPPQPVVVKHPVGCENYRELVSQYNWNVSIALAVMKAESGCNPNAVGDRHIPPVSCGLFQIRTLAGRPTCEQLKDPATNVAWAWKLYQASGWKPWSVCRTKISCY